MIGIDTAKAEEKRKSDIKKYADNLVLSRYPELTQRKLMSQAIKLIYKQLLVSPLSQSELDTLASYNAMMPWIEQVRFIENTAQANGAELNNIVWPA